MTNDANPESEFNQIVADYLEAIDRGDQPSRDEMLRRHPAHAESLRQFFRNHDSLRGTELPVAQPVEAHSSPAAEQSGPQDIPTIAPTGTQPVPWKHSSAGASTDSLPHGDRVQYFGDYEILSEIARGGMGVVYRARQVSLNRVVALKMILSGQLAGEEDILRFQSEAQAAANLDHPGIVPVFEIGNHKQQHYFSMGFVRGVSLADKLKQGPLPASEAVELMIQVADAISYAHGQGVIHRDLKPGNILLDEAGHPRVTDFGLAKRVDDQHELTATGQVLGTPSFMAPEQASGTEVTASADVYALGAILYHMLTGRPPFQAANPIDTIMQVLESDPPSARSLNSNTPRDLETICGKCLQKQPAKRYGHVDQFRDDLARFQKGEPISARPVGRLERTVRWAKRYPAIAGMMLLTTLALLAGTTASVVSAIRANANARLAEERADDLARRNSAINLLFAQEAYDNLNITRMIDALTQIPIEHRGWEWQWLEYLTDKSSYRYRIQGPFVLAEPSRGGHWIASLPDRWPEDAGQDSDLHILEAETGEIRQELKIDLTPPWHAVVNSDASLAAVLGRKDGENCLAMYDLVTATQLWQSPPLSSRTEPQFLVDGNRVAVPVRDEVLVFDARTGDQVQRIDLMAFPGSTAALSPNGQWMFLSGQIENFQLVDLSAGEFVSQHDCVHTAGVDVRFTPAVAGASFSPDSQQVAVAFGNSVQIYQIDNLSEPQIQLKHGDQVTSVEFISDGSIASADRDGIIKIWSTSDPDFEVILSGHLDQVEHLQYLAEEKRLISISRLGEVKSWHVDELRPIITTPPDISFFQRAELLGDGTRYVMSYRNDDLFQSEIRRVDDHQVQVELGEMIALTVDHHHGKLIGMNGFVEREDSLSGYCQCVLVDVDEPNSRSVVGDHQEGISTARLSHDEQFLIVGTRVGTLYVWDLEQDELVRKWNGHGRDDKTGPWASSEATSVYVTHVEFDSTGRWAVSVTPTEVKVWDLVNEDEWQIEGGAGIGRFSPNSSEILAGKLEQGNGPFITITQSLEVWDLETRQRKFTLNGHTSDLLAGAYSDKGDRIVTTAEDKTIRLWDSQTGEMTLRIDTGNRLELIEFRRNEIIGLAEGRVFQWSIPDRPSDDP